MDATVAPTWRPFAVCQREPVTSAIPKERALHRCRGAHSVREEGGEEADLRESQPAETVGKGRRTTLAGACEVAKRAPIGRVRRDPQCRDAVRPDHERDAAGGVRSRRRRARRTRRREQRQRKDEQTDAGPGAGCAAQRDQRRAAAAAVLSAPPPQPRRTTAALIELSRDVEQLFARIASLD